MLHVCTETYDHGPEHFFCSNFYYESVGPILAKPEGKNYLFKCLMCWQTGNVSPIRDITLSLSQFLASQILQDFFLFKLRVYFKVSELLFVIFMVVFINGLPSKNYSNKDI